MKPFSLRFPLLFLALTAAVCAAPPSLFLGPIPVQFVEPGGSVLLDLRRFHQPLPDSRIEVGEHPQLQSALDRAQGRLRLTVAHDAAGLIDLPITVGHGAKSLRSVITVAVRQPARHEFVYRAPKTVQSVTVAGSFNAWNRESHPLNRRDDGSFFLALPLPPGSHRYKFVVDGAWQPDPANPRREPDGYEGTNSIADVAAVERPGAIFAEAFSSKQIRLRCSSEGDLKAASVVAELPDGSARPLPAKIDKRILTVNLPSLPAGSWVRAIAIDREGGITNVVRVPLAPSVFRWQDAIIYYALTDRFHDGNQENNAPVQHPEVKPPANFHGGDWKGIEQKIREGYFRELGINTLWIAPLNQNPDKAYQEYPEPHRWYTGYHGYWPVSPTRVEPHFGDEAALRSLVQTAHQEGMKIIADLVLHHVHIEHPWWQKHRDWFGQLELPDGTKNLRLWDKHQFTTWFEPVPAHL